jgi:thiol-disulfide isomerase/thioredoxin
MKNIFIALLLTLSYHQVTAQNTVTIIGTVKGDLKGHKNIYVYGNGIKTDTAVITNGSFKFSLPFKKPFSPLFYDEYDAKVKGGISPFPVVIDQPGTVYINDIDIEKGLQSGKISGIKSAEEYQEFGRLDAEVSKETFKELQKKYGDSINPKSANYKAYIADMEARSAVKTAEILKKFVKIHPDSYTSTFILNSAKSSLSLGELELIARMLSQKAMSSEGGKIISTYIGGIKSSAPGKTVKEFTLNTPEDKPFNLSQLKGKYVIIDFWASWCGPCRQSFPHMREIYNKYKGDKFEIYSISVDQSKSAWLKAVNELKLPWILTLDTKNVASGSFAVSAIPTTYMIDPEGKILMKEIGFDSSGNSPLEKKLVELFGAK